MEVDVLRPERRTVPNQETVLAVFFDEEGRRVAEPLRYRSARPLGIAAPSSILCEVLLAQVESIEPLDVRG